PVTYVQSQREIRQLVEARGFRVRELFVDHIFPYRVADYIQYRYERRWIYRVLPRRIYRWLGRHFGWHICLTAEAIGDVRV
ncbi:MAG: class I SAM-dependent methyltransferase, partial [Candidatus Methylomirabilis sp.]